MSAASRPLRLRRRSDLKIEQQSYLGRRYWVIKDPLALKYYRFEEEEYTLLEMLDGNTSMEELQRCFESRFAPQKITLRELHQFVGKLHRSCLVVSDAPGQGVQLRKRERERVWRERLAAFSNILCIRFRGADADRLLSWLVRRLGWVFSAPCVGCCLALAAAAAVLLAVQFEVARSRLPAFDDFFASNNWFWLAAAVACTKILHEFGHGLSCKRMGGECHEMGLMLLVFTPCLYCNVSDSWMLPSKWKRAAIGAAGMYVEIVLAAACTFLWWFTEPGLLHYLCLDVMFVSFVGTLVFNANPLMRFDGYYILADLIEIPNLRQKASAILQRKLAAWLFGASDPPDPFVPTRMQFLLALFAVLSEIYRWVVSLSVLWFLYHLFEPFGLKILGQTVAAATLFGLLLPPLRQIGKFFSVPGSTDRMKKKQLLVTSLVLAALIAAVFLVPTPHYVRCSVYVEPQDAAAVYVESPGLVQQIHVGPGDAVKAGQPLLTLDNVDVRLAILRMSGERQQVHSRLVSLRHRAYRDETAVEQIAEVEEALRSLDEQLAQRRRDSERLKITAPVDGTVVAPPRCAKPQDESGRLPSWSGTPLDAENLHAFFDEGVGICQIGDPRRLKAILAIDQSDMEYVHVGQAVDVFLDQWPARVFHSRVEQLAQRDMQVSPPGLSSKTGGDLLTRTDSTGMEHPVRTTYQASAPFRDEQAQIALGGTGRARIRVGSLTVARRIWRAACQVFNFET